MATLDELSNALRNADAAGDVEAARMLASEIQKVQAAPKSDPYRATAEKEFSDLKAKGFDASAGPGRLFAQGMTFGAADDILAAAATPIEMLSRGTFNPAEGYRHAKAWQNTILDDARKNSGAVGTGMEILGGVGSGVGLARAGLTAGRALAPNAGLLARSGASAADGAAFGAVSGLMEGDSLSERGGNALQGGILGGAVGGAVPGILSVAGSVASPLVSNIRARVNPEGFARSQVARAVMEGNQTPQQLASAVDDAAREGQGMFTLADAMGNPGQRMLATTARSPGTARTDVVEFLERRQAGQGRRLANTLSEGFDAPQTAAQTRTALTAARDAAADAQYGAVRADAGRTDVVPAINKIDRTIGTGPGQTLQAANDSVESVLRPFRERLARVNPDDFEAVQRIRFDMADAAQNAKQSGYGNRAREIGNAVRELDAAMEQASSGYRQANRNFAQASKTIEAVDTGRTAALRGRPEDTIPAFRAMPAPQRTAFRRGYADPLIEQVQTAPIGANKARPFTSDAFLDESQAIAPLTTGNQMTRRIGRENTMFQTRNAATGNSKTAENLNDDAAMSVDPSLIMNVLSGNISGALKSAISAGSNALTGNTPAVRDQVARILLSRGQNVNPASIQRMLDQTVERIQLVQTIARQLGRGASGGLAVAPGATGQR